MEIAWEDYKEKQRENADQDVLDETYKKWEELKQQIQVYDDAVEKRKRNTETQAARHKVLQQS